MTDRRDRPASDADLRKIAIMTAEWFGASPEIAVDGGKSTIGFQSSRARMTAMYLMRLLTEASYERIGKILRRHHSTVLNGERQTLELMDGSPVFASSVRKLKAAIKSETGVPLITRIYHGSRLASPVDLEQKERATETA